MTSLLATAVAFATEAHKGQTRKYTGDPYINHPLAVAAIVGLYLPGDEEAAAAAVLHDVVEDCGVDMGGILTRFGRRVHSMVLYNSSFCSSPNLGFDRGLEAGRAALRTFNRYTRKAIDARWYALGDEAAQTVKVCDMIENTLSIVSHDPKFASVYLGEKRALLGLLRLARPEAKQYALNQATIGEAILASRGLSVKEVYYER